MFALRVQTAPRESFMPFTPFFFFQRKTETTKIMVMEKIIARMSTKKKPERKKENKTVTNRICLRKKTGQNQTSLHSVGMLEFYLEISQLFSFLMPKSNKCTRAVETMIIAKQQNLGSTNKVACVTNNTKRRYRAISFESHNLMCDFLYFWII